MSFPGTGTGTSGSPTAPAVKKKHYLEAYLKDGVYIPFDAMHPVVFEHVIDGSDIEYKDGEITMPVDGRIIMSVQVGAFEDMDGLGIIVFKNGAYFRQAQGGKAGIVGMRNVATAGVVAIDNCKAGDKYAIYAAAHGQDQLEYNLDSLHATSFLTVTYI